jgi:hypothetical protein
MNVDMALLWFRLKSLLLLDIIECRQQNTQYAHAVTKSDARTGNDIVLIPQGKAGLIKSTSIGSKLGYETLFFYFPG